MLTTTETLLKGLAAGDDGQEKKKGAFHSLLFKIAQNKAYDRATRQTREEEKLREFDARPLSLSPDDWRLATYDAALRRVMADPSVLETTKIAFRRYVQLDEAGLSLLTPIFKAEPGSQIEKIPH